MKPRIIYVVKQEHGVDNDKVTDIISAYRKREQAEALAATLNRNYVFTKDELFNIMPEEVYLSWPSKPVESKNLTPTDEEAEMWWNGFDSEYRGYTLSQYISQFVRCAIFAENYELSEIEEIELI